MISVECVFCHKGCAEGPIGELGDFYIFENIIACQKCITEIVKDAYEAEWITETQNGIDENENN